MAQSNTQQESRDTALLLKSDDEQLLLDFLQSLHFVDPGNFSQARNNRFEMAQIGDVENDFNARLAVGSLGSDVTNVALGVADHAGDAFQHSEAVIAKNRQLHR